MRRLPRFLCAVLLILAAYEKSFANNAILSWAPSASPNAAGYYVYFGITSGSYLTKFNAGNATSLPIPNLNVGIKYYFAVSTYDASGHESALSSEINYVVPNTLTLLPRANTSAPAVIQFQGAPGHWYEMQVSTNLKTWTTVSVWPAILKLFTQFQFIDTAAPQFKSRYYRTIVH